MTRGGQVHRGDGDQGLPDSLAPYLQRIGIVGVVNHGVLRGLIGDCRRRIGRVLALRLGRPSRCTVRLRHEHERVAAVTG